MRNIHNTCMLYILEIILNIGTLAKDIAERHRKRSYPKNYKPTRTALDDMLSLDRVEKGDTSEINVTDNVDVNNLPIVPAIVSKDPYDYSSDSSGQGTRFAKRTGNFDLDFPESPKTSKMKGQQSKKSSKNLADFRRQYC